MSGYGYYFSKSATAASRRQRLSFFSSLLCHSLIFLTSVGFSFDASKPPPKKKEQVTPLVDPRPRPPKPAPEPPQPKLPETAKNGQPVIEQPKLEPLIPVDESKIDISNMEIIFDDPPDAERLPQVLTNFQGGIAFGKRKEFPQADYLFQAGTWSRVELIYGGLSLDDYCPYQTVRSYRIVDELRRKNNIGNDMAAYILFPRGFNIGLNHEVRQFAAQRGQPGRVGSAVLKFSLTHPTGVEVVSVRMVAAANVK